MNKLICALAAPAIVLAAPAFAAVTVPYDPSFALTAGDVGSTFSMGFNGIVDGSVMPKLAANATFTLLSKAGDTWNFQVDFDNDLLGSVDGRISTFGLNSDPNIANAIAGAGPFNKAVTTNVNYPQTSTDLEFCFTAGPNCSGGGGGGILANTTGSQLFSLIYAPGTSSITLSNFVIRWQSLPNGGSGIGTAGDPYDPVDPFGGIPEPSSWAMLIAGFGLVGAVARRRKVANLTVAA